jgi:hypothetical protein
MELRLLLVAIGDTATKLAHPRPRIWDAAEGLQMRAGNRNSEGPLHWREAVAAIS